MRGERFRLPAGPVRVRLVQETPAGEQVALGLELVPLAPAVARNHARGHEPRRSRADGRWMVTEFRTTGDVLAGTYSSNCAGPAATLSASSALRHRHDRRWASKQAGRVFGGDGLTGSSWLAAAPAAYGRPARSQLIPRCVGARRAVGLFTRKPKRFWTEEAHRANLARQVGGVPQVLRQAPPSSARLLTGRCVSSTSSTPTQSRRHPALGEALRQKGYAVETGPSPGSGQRSVA